MQWYENNLVIEGEDVLIEGTFTDSVIKIIATYGDKTIMCLNKPVQIWAHQEILAEDILQKFQGKIQKFETKQLPLKIKSNRICDLD